MEIGDINKAKKIRDVVKEELKCIPRGAEPQNMLRSAYSALRMHSLGKRAQGEISEEAVRSKAVETVKRSYPDFKPLFVCPARGKKNGI